MFYPYNYEQPPNETSTQGEVITNRKHVLDTSVWVAESSLLGFLRTEQAKQGVAQIIKFPGDQRHPDRPNDEDMATRARSEIEREAA